MLDSSTLIGNKGLCNLFADVSEVVKSTEFHRAISRSGVFQVELEKEWLVLSPLIFENIVLVCYRYVHIQLSSYRPRDVYCWAKPKETGPACAGRIHLVGSLPTLRLSVRGRHLDV